MASGPSLLIALVVLSLSRLASCALGDICFIQGAKTAILNDQLYFMGGQYSIQVYGGQDITTTESLYSLNLTSQFPVERSITKALVNNITIGDSYKVAYQDAVRNAGDSSGALWYTDDTVYVFGGGFNMTTDATNALSAYNVTTGEWKEVEVSGGSFNFGNRTSSLVASVPNSGLNFVLGGTTPHMPGMIRFNASEPDNLSWTNETLGDGSNGIEVPNLESAGMVYIPAGAKGMLVAFGGSNVTDGIDPDWGWPYDSDWSLIYLYDIASHTWWKQKASGSYPVHMGSFCTGVSMAPDGSSIQITAYGGWSLNNGRSYETVYVLSLPSFTWIDATSLSDESNQDAVNSTIGRDRLAGACQTYRGSQMIVIGGEIRSGAYDLTEGACSDDFNPVRVLDLSTYKWQTVGLDTNATYEVPSVISDVIGGNSSGLATKISPSAGFADSTLSSALRQRVPTATATTSGTSSTASSNQNSNGTKSDPDVSHANASSIAGGVVGGVAGLALIAVAVFFLMRHRRRRQSNEKETEDFAATAGDNKAMLPMAEMNSLGVREMDGQARPPEAMGNEYFELSQDSPHHIHELPSHDYAGAQLSNNGVGLQRYR